MLTRFPDGIEGKSFYQKDAPAFAPDWIRTVSIWSEDTQREIRYFVCDSVEALLYIANMGTIPLHLWASRVDSLERPDWCVLDLDPKDAPFSDVITVANVIHELCEAVSLPDFVKTTGKTGLHILLPLGRQCTYEQSRTLGELLARLVIRELPKITTITRQVQRRGAKVYIDYLQNRHGQTIVAPFSVRPLPGATVSMPLEWKEVNAKLDPTDYTIRTAPERMAKKKKDPVVPVLAEVPDLGGGVGEAGGEVGRRCKRSAFGVRRSASSVHGCTSGTGIQIAVYAARWTPNAERRLRYSDATVYRTRIPSTNSASTRPSGDLYVTVAVRRVPSIPSRTCCG